MAVQPCPCTLGRREARPLAELSPPRSTASPWGLPQQQRKGEVFAGVDGPTVKKAQAEDHRQETPNSQRRWTWDKICERRVFHRQCGQLHLRIIANTSDVDHSQIIIHTSLILVSFVMGFSGWCCWWCQVPVSLHVMCTSTMATGSSAWQRSMLVTGQCVSMSINRGTCGTWTCCGQTRQTRPRRTSRPSRDGSSLTTGWTRGAKDAIGVMMFKCWQEVQADLGWAITVSRLRVFRSCHQAHRILCPRHPASRCALQSEQRRTPHGCGLSPQSHRDQGGCGCGSVVAR